MSANVRAGHENLGTIDYLGMGRVGCQLSKTFGAVEALTSQHRNQMASRSTQDTNSAAEGEEIETRSMMGVMH